MLFADSPAILDHHESDTSRQSSIYLGIMEPAIHVEVGLVVQCPFGTYCCTNLDGNEINRKDGRQGKEHNCTAEFGLACKLIQKNQSQKDANHSYPLIDSHISINVK